LEPTAAAEPAIVKEPEPVVAEESLVAVAEGPIVHTDPTIPPIGPPPLREPWAGAISGRVVGEDGSLVESGSVSGGHRSRYRSRIINDGHCRVERGRFAIVLSSRPEEGRLLLSLRAKGYAPLKHCVSADDLKRLLGGKPVLDLEIVMRRAATVEGTVRFRGSAPVDSIKVGLTRDPYGRDYQPWVKLRYNSCSGDGRFRLGELEPGDDVYLIALAWMDGYGLRRIPSRPVPLGERLRAGETVHIDVEVEEDRDVDIDLFVRGWREGLLVRLDRDRTSEMEEPRLTLHAMTGQHRIAFRYAGEREWSRDITFFIPHDQTTFEVDADLLR
jgi:hypothetical protein